MSQERLTLRKIKEILRLKYEAGLSNRAIAGACKISNSTVGLYLQRAEAAGLGWPLAEGDEEKLYQQLFPEKANPNESQRPLPNWEAVRKELRQKGVTLRLVWMEYIERTPDGYQYSQFCEYYRRWKKAHVEPTRRREHVGGEQMQVDYAGMKVRITDPKSGKVSQAQVFVAVLPASNYTYAEAQESANQCNWNNGHVRAMAFFGGVPRIVVPDNLKTGVKKPNYYEPEINPAYQALAEHYHFVVLPARVRKPRDKGKVENSVQNVERWVLAPLRHRTFFSLAEANQAIRNQLELFNNRIMKLSGRSRRQEFEEIDRPNLRPLPKTAYEYAERKTARVNLDYHVEFEHNLYSVPHNLIHQEVEIRATERMLEIFYQGKSVAVHLRGHRRGRFFTQSAHMPANHQFLEQVNASQLVQWGTAIGPQTTALIQATLKSRPFPEQAYRTCLGILSLSRKYAPHWVETACQTLLESRTCSYAALKAELEWLTEHAPATAEPEALPAHENIRGHNYYR